MGGSGLMGVSSNILKGGLISSLYWPVLTLQRNAPKKRAATEILANNRIRMTLIVGCCVDVKLWAVKKRYHDITQ
jgi:hypothetical protein